MVAPVVSLVCDMSGPIHTRSVRLAWRRVMLGSGGNPAVLRRRDGADDESSRRAIEGYVSPEPRDSHFPTAPTTASVLSKTKAKAKPKTHKAAA